MPRLPRFGAWLRRGPVSRVVMIFSGIRTVAKLIGYLATVAREKGWDEVEVVAVFIKVATPCREHVCEAEQLLRQLGYTAVCDHLRKMAPHLQPKPPSRWVRN